MFQNNNGAIIRRLAGRKLRADRRRNWGAVLTIAITAILFTALLTTGACTVETQQYYAVHQVGTMAHATLHSITKEQYDKIRENPAVREIGYKLPVADSVDNPGFSEWPVTMSYMDDTALRMSLSQPVMGKKPQAQNEIAADAGTLDRLGIPCRVGAQVPVSYMVGGEKEEAVFILSGWCQSEPRIQKGFIAVSKSYVDSHAAELANTAKKSGSQVGRIDSGIYFSNGIHVTEKSHALLTDCGYDWNNKQSPNYIQCDVNEAYRFIDGIANIRAILDVLAVLLILILAGWLILGNTFRIFIRNSTLFYGMLKTIGTTGRQIRRIVRRQVLSLSVIGIPMGMIAGFSIGNFSASVILSAVSTDHMAGTELTFSIGSILFIGIGSAFFSLLTVLLSVRTPGRIAAGASPMEALRFPEDNPDQERR